jgi:drug/metabolite transporter (DMT)-like permease
MSIAADLSVSVNQDALIGGVAGLATSALWVATSLCFTSAGRRIGATLVNTLRLVVAIVLLGVTHRLLSGLWWPEMQHVQLFYLALSGLIGLTICDQALFTAFVDIGPRRALLLMTTSPLVAVVLGVLAFGEAITFGASVGILMTLAGIFWVLMERQPSTTVGSEPLARNPHATRGVILALIAAVCQAIGFMYSKKGIGHGVVEQASHLDPQAATFVRMVFGAIGMLPILILYWMHRSSPGRHASRQRRIGTRGAGYGLTAMGAVVGPYLGVWMSLVAMDRIPLGIAQTLCSLSPVLILPVVGLVYKERVNRRAVLGASMAVVGSIVLILSAAM